MHTTKASTFTVLYADEFCSLSYSENSMIIKYARFKTTPIYYSHVYSIEIYPCCRITQCWVRQLFHKKFEPCYNEEPPLNDEQCLYRI